MLLANSGHTVNDCIYQLPEVYEDVLNILHVMLYYNITCLYLAMTSLLRNSLFLDKFAVSTSAFCAVHCLFLPVIISVFPAIGTTILGRESFHMWLLICVIPLSLVALSMGCKQHKSWVVAVLGFIGISILIFTAAFGHEVFGHNGESIVTLMGVTAIALGHLQNYKLCRHNSCKH